MERRITPTNSDEYLVRPLEQGEPPVRPLEPVSRSQTNRGEPVIPLQPGSRSQPVQPLEPGSRSQTNKGEPVMPLKSASRLQTQREGDGLGPVDLGADPRKLGQYRRNVTESSSSERSKSPLHVRQKVIFFFIYLQYANQIHQM